MATHGAGKVRQQRVNQDALDRVTTSESEQVLRELLRRHPELRAAARAIAAATIADVSVDRVRQDVADRVRVIGLEELNGRAGSHSWGYVEPSEAAWDLLEEAIEEIRDDIRRRKEAGQDQAAAMVCHGLILGLYEVRQATGDGALAWAPDFPAEAAGWVLSEFLALLPRAQRSSVGGKLLAELRMEASEWAALIEQVAKQADK